MKKIIIINGPNVRLNEFREQYHYGNFSFPELENKLQKKLENFDIALDIYYLNSEGEIIDKIHTMVNNSSYIGLIINPGAYSHYSYAIADALALIKQPKIEVHLSNIFNREDFRKNLVTGGKCDGIVCGLKESGYLLALEYLIEKIEK